MVRFGLNCMLLQAMGCSSGKQGVMQMQVRRWLVQDGGSKCPCLSWGMATCCKTASCMAGQDQAWRRVPSMPDMDRSRMPSTHRPRSCMMNPAP